MSDAAIFVLVFGGLFVLRIIAATFVFLMLLPKGDRCPVCDHPTVRVTSFLFDRGMPWFRKSWCLTCGWTGLLRRGPLTERPAVREHAGRR
ncbi:MAG: hypothetical protein ACT4P7_15505 [Gemmatimonadaceae bacterium]